jgi:putative FmdB family regulatory protein
MPIYVYKCPECGQQFDKMQPFSAANVYPCPNCHTEAKRKIQPAGIVFKGSGWYITDSRKADEAKRDAVANQPASEVAAPRDDSSPASGDATPAAPATAPASIELSSTPA